MIKNRLQKRISLYTSDKLIASQIWCDILGLKGGVSQPSRKQVEGSPVFQLRGPKQGDKTISNISGHWISILADYKALGDAPLGQFKPPEGWPTVYSWESFRKYAPNVVKKLWVQRKNRPSLVVLVPSDLAEVPASFFLENLHKLESIRRKSVYYVETSMGSQQTQTVLFLPLLRSPLHERRCRIFPYEEASRSGVPLRRLFGVQGSSPQKHELSHGGV